MRVADNAKQKLDMPGLCRPMAETSPLPMAAVEGASHIVRYVNPAFCLLAGKPEEELIGNPFSDAVTADDEFLALLDRVYRTGQAEMYSGQESPTPAAFWSYAMWPALAADGRTIGIIIQVTESKPAHEQAVAMNQALMLSVVHQHELTEAAETLNANLQTEIAQRKRVEEELHDSDVVVRFDRDLRYIYVNTRTEQETGLPSETMVGKTPGELGIPESVGDIVTRSVRRVFETGRSKATELSYPSPGGVTYWEANFIPEFGGNGGVQSVLSVARDVTEKKRLERVAQAYAQEVQALAGGLLTAQEEERRKVSRELHDQICQQLASLAFDIGGLAAHTRPPKNTQVQLKALQARVVKVSEEVRHIAYEMHPSVVDDLGLEISLKALCDEFAKEQDFLVEFKNDSLPLTIPLEVASGLYRIAQESLQNIVNHARAKHVTVQLVHRERELRLSIEDDGVGFHPSAVKGKGSLGLVSMEERARLLNAGFSIESKLRHGTRIAVRVPLHQELQ